MTTVDYQLTESMVHSLPWKADSCLHDWKITAFMEHNG